MRFLATLAVLACSFFPRQLGAAPADRAFIVIVDGLRNDEGFEAESTHLRHIWNDLRPLGTINRRFWNQGWTSTTPGHLTIMSGVRQAIRNNGGTDCTNRSYDPLLFEYYRRHLGAPESDCGVFYGKWGNCAEVCDFGLEPAFGEAYRGFQSAAENSHEDTANLRNLFDAMDSTRPKLVLINLKNVDDAGHSGDYAAYLGAIRAADSLVYELYRRIQAVPPYTDTFYKDRTLFIVTSDHGRNDNAHRGFSNHGQWDHGCRDLAFWAFGPGVAAGRDTCVRRGLVDIVPTVGAVLGFPTPFAEGQVMTELFVEGCAPVRPAPPGGTDGPARNLSGSSGFSRDPDVARDRTGSLHLVWSDNTPGKWSVRYRRSTDDGATWSAARTMFDYPGTDSVMQFARVAADDSVAIAATGYARHACPVDPVHPLKKDTTVLWYPWIATSTDNGANWTELSLFDSTMVSSYPAFTVRNGRYALAWSRTGTFSWQPVRNGPAFNRRLRSCVWTPLPVRLDGMNALQLSAADDVYEHHVAVSGLPVGQDADLVYFRSADGLNWSRTDVTADPVGSPMYDLDPELAVDRFGAAHLFWSRKPDSGGVWQVMYGRLDSAAAMWVTVSLVQSPGGAWQPHAAVKGDTICLAWTDYRDGNPEVYARFSTNLGRVWGGSIRVTRSNTLTHHPRVSPAGAGFYLVWQDFAGGNWDVFGRRLDVNEAPPPAGWHEVASMPLPPSGKPVKRGGWLEVNPSSGLIYGQKGYKTTDFYSYNAWLDKWTPLSGMPYQSHPRWGSKPPRAGSRGCSDRGDVIYVTQGNNTLGFWSYHITGDSWTVLPDVPEGASRKKVKGGTDMAWVTDAGGLEYLYLLKGYRNEFYRFDIAARSWERLEDAPVGARDKWDKGSWLVADPEGGRLYAHKARYNELWPLDLSTRTWGGQLPGMPLTGMLGHSRKSKDGGSACRYEGDVYALKGGNTQEFWTYSIAGDTWVELDTLPAFGSTGRKKRVKYGADIVHLDNGMFFALKGNKTLEFWRCVLAWPEPGPEGPGIETDDTDVLGFGFVLGPSPLARDRATVRYSLPAPGPVELHVFDACGRLVRTTRSFDHSVTGSLALDLTGLNAGVYLVRLESGDFSATRKLVLR